MLTDGRIRAAKPSDRQYRLADYGGLYLQVEPSGGRYWRFNYRLHGRQKTLALGVYPDVSLVKARARHQVARSSSRTVSILPRRSRRRESPSRW